MNILKRLLFLVMALVSLVVYAEDNKTNYEKAQLECAKKAAGQTKVPYDQAYDDCMDKKGFSINSVKRLNYFK